MGSMLNLMQVVYPDIETDKIHIPTHVVQHCSLAGSDHHWDPNVIRLGSRNRNILDTPILLLLKYGSS